MAWKLKRRIAKMRTLSHPEHQYLDALEYILENGIDFANRTGTDARTVFGYTMRFDLSKGFPALTTKRLAFNVVAAELIGFLAGYDNAADFRKLGCKIWDKDANENADWLSNPNRKGEDDLGRVYGVQWRSWRGADGKEIDQLKQQIETIKNNPYDRRLVVSAFNPAELDQMALPPCHLFFQFFPDPVNRKLNLLMYQRSCDMFLGVPFNIASYSLLLHIVAQITGYRAGELIHVLGNAHIYHNHFDQVKEQLSRKPLPLPRLKASLSIVDIDDVHEFAMEELDAGSSLKRAINRVAYLENYKHHPAIKAEMLTTPKKEQP